MKLVSISNGWINYKNNPKEIDRWKRSTVVNKEVFNGGYSIADDRFVIPRFMNSPYAAPNEQPEWQWSPSLNVQSRLA
jgi:hypothetical protein